MRTVRPLIDLVIVVLGAARMTRFVTEDSLGYWWVVRPLRRWANTREGSHHRWDGSGRAAIPANLDEDPDPEQGWRSKLVSGADCRWCVGFWLGVLILVSDVLTRTTVFGWARPLWRFVLGALSLNVASNAVGKWTSTLT